MAQIRRRPEPTYEEFQPKYDWTFDNDSDVLLVDLPGFKKEELKVQVDNLGRVMVSGERQVNVNKCSRFRQIFEAPQGSDISKISGRFDGGLLFIYIPRKIAQTSTITAPIAKEEPKKDKMKIPENITKGEEEKITRQEIKEGEEEGKNKLAKVTEEEARDEKKVSEAPNYQEEKITTEERPEAEKIRSGEIAKEGISSKKKDDNEEGEVREKTKKDGEYEEFKHDDEVKKEKKGKKRRMKAQEKEEKESYIKELERKLADERLKGRQDQLQGLMADAVQEIKKNKNIIITAVLAFSLGFYLSRKFRSNGE